MLAVGIFFLTFGVIEGIARLCKKDGLTVDEVLGLISGGLILIGASIVMSLYNF